MKNLFENINIKKSEDELFLEQMKKDKEKIKLQKKLSLTKLKEMELGDNQVQEFFENGEYEVIKSITDKIGIEFDYFLRLKNNDTLEIIFESDFLDKLPEGFYYKGGAARSALERFLELDLESTPRDIDLVYEGEQGQELIDELSEKYMPDDFANNYGAEKLEEDYFETRDFTFNEVLYDGKKIQATKEAVLDLYQQRIRITDFEKQENWYDWKRSGKYNWYLENLIDKTYLNKKYEIVFENEEGCEEIVDEDELIRLEKYKKEKEKFMNENPFIKYKILAKSS